MNGSHDDLAREAALFSDLVDPIVRELLDAADPWDAYVAAVKLRGSLIDDLDWMPHGGGVFVAWADLEDLYETGKTPIPDAHAALRRAATDWLGRPQVPDATCIEGWISSTAEVVKFLVDRDGDFWSSPE